MGVETWTSQCMLHGNATKYNEIFAEIEKMDIGMVAFSETNKKVNGNEKKANYKHFNKLIHSFLNKL